MQTHSVHLWIEKYIQKKVYIDYHVDDFDNNKYVLLEYDS